jgi:hypothetical protein
LHQFQVYILDLRNLFFVFRFISQFLSSLITLHPLFQRQRRVIRIHAEAVDHVAWHWLRCLMIDTFSQRGSGFSAKPVHQFLTCCLSTISMVLCKIILGVKFTLVELGTKLMEDGNQRIYFIDYIWGINHFQPSLP